MMMTALPHITANPSDFGMIISEKPYRKINPATSDYHDGYSVAPGFLAWIVYKYDRRIVPMLDKSLCEGNYSEDIWTKTVGKSLDALWAEFAATLTTQQ